MQEEIIKTMGDIKATREAVAKLKTSPHEFTAEQLKSHWTWLLQRLYVRFGMKSYSDEDEQREYIVCYTDFLPMNDRSLENVGGFSVDGEEIKSSSSGLLILDILFVEKFLDNLEYQYLHFIENGVPEPSKKKDLYAQS